MKLKRVLKNFFFFNIWIFRHIKLLHPLPMLLTSKAILKSHAFALMVSLKGVSCNLCSQTCAQSFNEVNKHQEYTEHGHESACLWLNSLHF